MRVWLAVLLLVLLSGCGSIPQPFAKREPLPSNNAMIAPPWEAMVAAGPGAAYDIDLETLNGPGASPPSLATAETAVPTPAPAQKVKPTGKEITAVAVVPVKGAPGKGNDELTRAMRATMTKAGWTVLNAPSKNALTIFGRVVMAPATGATQKVSLRWDVQTPDGKNLGDVKQANDVPAGSLDGGWGENAGFAAEAAATGIYDLINKYR